MSAIVKPITAPDIEQAAVAAYQADGAQVLTFYDRANFQEPERIAWFALSIRKGGEWSIVGRRRTKVELMILARRGPVNK